MLMLIAEVLLTIVAWRKGWRWWALIPGFLAFGVGFAVGAATEISGGNSFSAMPYAIFIDIIAIFALICMAGTNRYERGSSVSQMIDAVKEVEQFGAKRALGSYGDDTMREIN